MHTGIHTYNTCMHTTSSCAIKQWAVVSSPGAKPLGSEQHEGCIRLDELLVGLAEGVQLRYHGQVEVFVVRFLRISCFRHVPSRRFTVHYYVIGNRYGCKPNLNATEKCPQSSALQSREIQWNMYKDLTTVRQSFSHIFVHSL